MQLVRLSQLGRIGGRVTGGGDTNAPMLSSASAGTPTSDGATGFGVTTNEGNGTLYWAVVTNGGSCTDTQLKAGSGGNIVAGKAGNQAVTGTGAQTVTSVTGLTASTTYQIKYLHRDAAGNDSSQASVSLTTAAAGDTYWANVGLLALNNNGANGTTTFTDQSSSALTLTTLGNAAWTNAQAPTGLTTSMSADGAGDGFSVADHANFNFGSGDFTVELWVRWNSTVGNSIFLHKRTNTNAFRWMTFYQSGTSVQWFATSNGTSWDIASAKAVGTVATGSWYHIALVRSGNSWTPYLNGTAGAGTVTSASALNVSTEDFVVGKDTAGAGDLNGWVGSVRITKGVARWTANFTPPSLPLPNS